MKWILPVMVVVLLTLAVLDIAVFNSSATENIAQVLGPYAYS